jgi:hypothetical protein
LNVFPQSVYRAAHSLFPSLFLENDVVLVPLTSWEQARALTRAQRSWLYGHDELAMAVARVRLRDPGEVVPPEHEAWKILAEEIPARNQVPGGAIQAEGVNCWALVERRDTRVTHK